MTATLLRDMRYVIRNTFSKFALLFILSTLYLILYTPSAFAQTTASSSAQPTTNYQLQTTNPYIPPNSPHGASQAFYNFGHALSCILVGQSPVAPCLEYKFIKDTQGMVRSVPVLSSVNTSGGLIGLGGSMLAMLYDNRPIDQMSFVAYLGKNIGIIDEANAQVPGSGNQVLSPIFALWSVSRNFAYLVMITVFIIVGLMVMFRQKLNPQTVVSVQLALPGLVVGLIMITFSYFLSALITDTAYLATDLVGYYFDQAVQMNGGPAITKPLTESLKDQNALSVGADTIMILDETTLAGLLGQFYSYLPDEGKPAFSIAGQEVTLLYPKRVVGLFAGAMTYMFYNTMLSPIADIGGGLIGTTGKVTSFATKALSFSDAARNRISSGFSVFGTVFGGGGTTIAGVLAVQAYNDPVWWLSYWATILAMVIMIYTLLKLFFKLINNYLMIIFLTIASPFVFLASAIPGRQDMATSWMRNMLCNVLAFPAVIGVFYFAAFLLGNNDVKIFGITNPLYLTNATGNLPFLGGFDTTFLRKVLAFAAILATPSIPDVICRTVGKPGQSGALLGGAIGGAIGAGRSYEGQLTGQIQKGAQDMGSWKQSLLGTTPYSGGRFGKLQVEMAKARLGRNPLSHAEAIGAHNEDRAWYNPERWIESVRRGVGGPYSAGDRQARWKRHS